MGPLAPPGCIHPPLLLPCYTPPQMLDRGDSGKVSLAECAASVMEIFK